MRLVITICCAMALATSSASAACVLDDYSVRAEYGRSAVVALALVVSERSEPEQPERGLLDGTVYTLRLQEAFRGHPSSTIEVFSENSSGRFPMVKGRNYLVFLYSQLGWLSADYCGNSGLVSDKQSVIREVRELAHSR